ncbi:MAG TPA: histidinol-phosphatase HisJ family protein [Desulfobacteraceae bacterium]|nr:histidinol-phosphatase [Deltaproteobacteria bacterium]MBW2355488.1 histidinol-phosphatase [Deltaproteobacteria bacterium]HDI60009.1 histidinol-phosphatase HisJ family protein [Desulfobacteraceae bacterium]
MARVSVHGGHSGQFCSHAADDLASVVAAYAAQGFAWVGLTEHMPPPEDRFLYPEERQAGFDAAALRRRFAAYMAEARRLQRHWEAVLPLRVGFETEACSGALDLARQLVTEFHPDYIVGSVHHVADIPIDVSPAVYADAAARCGGIEELYLAYFDLQLEMIETLRPQVIGHFDLVRIFDPDYPRHLASAPVGRRIVRNLERVRQMGAILDLNVAAWDKGGSEPYPAAGIRWQARRLGIALVPGDDSHGVATVGRHFDRAVALLEAEGFSTDWPIPGL